MRIDDFIVSQPRGWEEPIVEIVFMDGWVDIIFFNYTTFEYAFKSL